MWANEEMAFMPFDEKRESPAHQNLIAVLWRAAAFLPAVPLLFRIPQQLAFRIAGLYGLWLSVSLLLVLLQAWTFRRRSNQYEDGSG